MNKQDFLIALRKGLSGLPQDEIEERLTFYGEMIDDRIEEGLSEEDAVSAVGSAEEIVNHAVEDIPLVKIAKERIKPKRRLKAWEIVLLLLGSPIWLSLSIAAAAVILSVYITVWAVIICLWAIFASFAVCAAGSIPACIVFIIGKNQISGAVMLLGGIVCAGLSIFMFFGCKAVTKGILILTKKIALRIKSCFIRKENAK